VIAIREVKIEKYLKDKIEQQKGKAFKLTSPGNSGVPDRLVLLPGGLIRFVELKAPGKQLKPMQAYRKRELEKLGFVVSVVDSMQKVDDFINDIQSASISGDS